MKDIKESLGEMKKTLYMCPFSYRSYHGKRSCCLTCEEKVSFYQIRNVWENVFVNQ